MSAPRRKRWRPALVRPGPIRYIKGFSRPLGLVHRPLRLVAQDAGLSRRKQGFDSPRGRQPSKEAMGIYKLLNFNDIFSPRVYNGEYSNVASM